VPDLIVELMQRYDVLLGELMTHLHSGDRLVVLSDHGMERSREPGLSGQHASKKVAVGVFTLWGPGIRAGARLPPASPFDVLPTILELLGVPASANMRGKVVTAAFASDRAPLPRRPTPYARHRAGTGDAASPADQKILERLRALGYVQ
jgi:arylsulfatase A-like enzyme